MSGFAGKGSGFSVNIKGYGVEDRESVVLRKKERREKCGRGFERHQRPFCLVEVLHFHSGMEGF